MFSSSTLCCIVFSSFGWINCFAGRRGDNSGENRRQRTTSGERAKCTRTCGSAGTRKKTAQQERGRKISSWSTKMLEEVASKQECEDTEEMVHWRNISQEDINELWKERQHEGVSPAEIQCGRDQPS